MASTGAAPAKIKKPYSRYIFKGFEEEKACFNCDKMFKPPKLSPFHQEYAFTMFCCKACDGAYWHGALRRH